MASPQQIQWLIELLRSRNITRGARLGPVQKDVFTELMERNAKFSNPNYTMTGNDIRHLQKSRMEKPKPKDVMPPEKIGGMVNSLTGSTRARVVTAKTPYPEGIVVPHGDTSYFGVLRPENGKVGFQTAYAPETKKLPNKLGSDFFERLSYRDWENATSPFNYAPVTQSGREFTQRELSAVNPGLPNTLLHNGSSVKGIWPVAVGGGLFAALGASDTRAQQPDLRDETRPDFWAEAAQRELWGDERQRELWGKTRRRELWDEEYQTGGWDEKDYATPEFSWPLADALLRPVHKNVPLSLVDILSSLLPAGIPMKLGALASQGALNHSLERAPTFWEALGRMRPAEGAYANDE